MYIAFETLLDLIGGWMYAFTEETLGYSIGKNDSTVETLHCMYIANAKKLTQAVLDFCQRHLYDTTNEGNADGL